MFGFLCRMIGCLALAAGVVVAIGDIARSLGADAVRLASFGQTFSLFSEPGAGAPSAAEPFSGLFALITTWPAAPVLGAVGLLFLALGRRRREPRLLR